MPVSKVIYGVDTLIDLTADTIMADKLRTGYTAHKADGELITGTLNTAAIEPYVYDLNCGWVGPGNGVWTYENPTNTYVDMYEVTEGHSYFFTWGATTGTRGRMMFTTVDLSTVTSGKVTGTAVNTSGYDNPTAYKNLIYTPSSDGYLVVSKDNVGVAGIKTYLYDRTASWL